MLDIMSESGDIHHFYAGIKGETLVTSIGNIAAKYVRLGWVGCPAVTLYNAHNLPASPFEIEIANTTA